MRSRSIFVGLVLVLMLAYSVAVYMLVIPQRRALVERGWNATPRGEDGAEVVVTVDPVGAAASSLRVGDEVVALNGERVENSDALMEAAHRRVPRGEPYVLTVRRGGQLLDLTMRDARAPLSAWLTNPWRLAVLLITVVYLGVGFAVFALKPNDKQVWLLALALCTWGAPFEFPQLSGDLPPWLTALLLSGFFFRFTVLAFVLHLFLVFPEQVAFLRRRPWLIYFIYLPAVLNALLGLAFNAAELWGGTDNRLLLRLRQPGFWNTTLPFTGLFAYLVAALLTLALQYRRADEVSRRKLRIILVGSLVGIGSLVVLLPLSGWLAETHPTLSIVTATIMDVLQCAMPLSFAYAIVRHQVIPVKLIIRRGLQYLLARNALRMAIALPVVGLLVSVIADPHRTLADMLLRNSFYFYLLLAAALALGLVFRRRLSDWIDRKFFREQYDQEKILRALVDDVKRLDSMPEMSRRVTEEVERALHPERAYLFYREREHGDLSLSYTSGGTPHDLRIPDSFQLLRFMELQGGAQDFPFPPKTNLPQSEKDWLAALDARLVVPMTGTDSRLAGLFILGGKKSEVPYTARDRELLESVAGQIAIVYENLRLKGRVQEDRKIRHEVLSRFEGQKINLLKECPRCGRCFDSAASACDADGAELTLTLPVERTVEGRYRLERLIGKGGMGAVYEATHLKLNHKVAVKILGGQMFGDPSALRRFEREAQALARLSQHPNIVSVHDYGELATEGAFLVMDLIEGESLGSLLKRERRVAPARAADIFEQVLEGLGAAHAAGVVHRDLKPDNVFLSRAADGRANVRLLDFGLAKLTQELAAGSQAPTAREPVTTPGAVMGTFGYMPPEQLTGGRVDERSDIFPVGVMIVEALTGERPFKGKTLQELLTGILHGAYHLPGDGAEARRLDAALQRCLAKDPAARFATAAEAKAQLTPALRDYTPHANPADAETIIVRQS
ncbi:MAG TPA: protein kinase [Pyrinomonadaceae bacterium]|nr:protein kinase [Pyrinomonadaceae bacterium]